VVAVVAVVAVVLLLVLLAVVLLLPLALLLCSVSRRVRAVFSPCRRSKRNLLAGLGSLRRVFARNGGLPQAVYV